VRSPQLFQVKTLLTIMTAGDSNRARDRLTLASAPWWWWKARPCNPVAGPATMIIIGILLNIIGLGVICWALFTLAVYAFPLFVLCGSPHKTKYVAS